MSLLITLFYIVFILSAIVLVVVILLQEGKGGGLTSALGTSGQQTFGVGASGIIKFTGWVGGIFLVSALAIHYFNRIESGQSMVDDFGQPQVLPIDPNAGVPANPPSDGGGAPPPSDGAPK
jgi:preprotein translocase subunit SecG